MRYGGVRRVLRSRILQQAALFTGSNVLVSGIGLVVKVLLARSLAPEDFGAYSFAVSFLLFAALFFDFGIFLPAARLAALAQGAESRQVIGSALLLYVPVAAVFGATIVGLSFGVDAWFNVEVGDALLVAAPLALAYPLAHLSVPLAQGLDRLNASSASAAVGHVLFLGAVVILVYADSVDVTVVLALRGVSLLVSGAILVAWLRPSFTRARLHARRLLRDARSYGFQVYVGRVLSVGTYQMDVLMLAVYADPASVGYYALAGALAYALGLPVLGMATALFPRMATADVLEARWIVLSAAIGAVMFAGAALAAGPLIALVFPPGYAPVAALVLPLVAAEAVRGVTSMYNAYLSAHGMGRELRNAALVLTGSNVALNVALIPPFGASGAAWASLLALVANLAAHVVAYRRSHGVLRSAAVPG